MQNNKEVFDKWKRNTKEKYNRFKNFAKSNTKLYIASIAVFVGIILLVIGLATGWGAGKESKTSDAIEIKQDAIPEINTLVTQYYSTLITADSATLATLVDDPDKYTNLVQQKSIVESYNNISCYTAPGLEENTYVVFVYWEIKFLNVTTMAPGLDTLYIVYDEESGKYSIHSDISDEIAAYYNTVAQNEQVQTLFEETNTKCNEAVNADANLKAIYNYFIQSAQTETESGETTNTEQTTTAAQ